MPENKKTRLKKHTQKRLRERYSLRYTQNLFDTLMNHVHSGKAKAIEKRSLRTTLMISISPPALSLFGLFTIKCAKQSSLFCQSKILDLQTTILWYNHYGYSNRPTRRLRSLLP
jgi:hypothetical protein